MIIGSLTKRCRIEKKVAMQEPIYGTEIIFWETVATVWCDIKDTPPRRDEAVRDSVVYTGTKTRLRMRYRSDVDTSMRVILMRPTEAVWNIIGGPSEIGNRDGVEFFIEKVAL